MRVTLLDRGGMSVYGGGGYNARLNAAVVLTGDSRDSAATWPVTIECGSVPSNVSATADGATVSTPSVSGNQVLLTLSAVQPGADVRVTLTVGGQVRVIRIVSEDMLVRGDYTSPEYVG